MGEIRSHTGRPRPPILILLGSDENIGLRLKRKPRSLPLAVRGSDSVFLACFRGERNPPPPGYLLRRSSCGRSGATPGCGGAAEPHIRPGSSGRTGDEDEASLEMKAARERARGDGERCFLGRAGWGACSCYAVTYEARGGSSGEHRPPPCIPEPEVLDLWVGYLWFCGILGCRFWFRVSAVDAHPDPPSPQRSGENRLMYRGRRSSDHTCSSGCRFESPHPCVQLLVAMVMGILGEVL